MSEFNAIPRLTPRSQFVGDGGASVLKTALTAVIAAIAAALLGSGWHSQAYADSPTPTSARASQSPDAASQALRRYALQLLHILSNPDANRWERYRQSMPLCAAAPAYLAEIGATSDADLLDSVLIALTEDLCADLDRRLYEARTVGLLVNEPQAMRGYVLIPGSNNNHAHLIDHSGRIVHSWQFENRVSHAKLLDNGNLLVGYGGSRYSAMAEIDSDNNVVWEYAPPVGELHRHDDFLHHDFLSMPNGNVLVIAQGTKTKQESIAAGANPDVVPSGGMWYDYLIEVRPTGTDAGEIVWEWSTWDYIVQDFDPTKPNYGDPSEHPELIDINFLVETPYINLRTNTWDWLHTNGIDYNPELDQIMLSPRQYSELWIIDRGASAEEAPTRKGGNSGKSGALLYRWGNPRAYGHGTAADRQLLLQHHTQWIAPGLPGEGNILVFNNGWALEKYQSRNYSSIEEIVPPVDGYRYRRESGSAYPPAEPIWSYAAEHPSDFFSRRRGCVQRLPNGNTLICESALGAVFQVTPDGNLVWKYVYPMHRDTPLKQGAEVATRRQANRGNMTSMNAIYRAYWYAPDYPGLQKYDLTPGDAIELYE